VEPLSAAFGFATIIGLIADFRTQKTGAKLDEFIEWLKETEHGRIAREIEQRDSLSEQLQAVLSLNHEELSMRLDSLDRILSSIARHINVFSGLAESIHPAHELSKQAVSIVKQFADSGVREFWISSTLRDGAPELELIDAKKPKTIKYDETRFIEDDLKKLVNYGILDLKESSNTRRYLITRKAVQLAKLAD